MELIKILYQPYVICIFLALIITLITYFIIMKDNKSKSEDKIKSEDNSKSEDKNNNTKILLYTFIISFLVLMILKYILDYANKNNFFQKIKNKDISDNLTIIADDIDIGII